MPRKCYVPGCKSNYDSTRKRTKEIITTFAFPKDERLFHEWLRAIPKKDTMPTKTSAVCAVHFNPEDVLRGETWKDNRGNILTCVFKIPKLTDGAVPSIFPNVPSYLSTKPSCSRADPERRFNTLRCESQMSEFLNSEVNKHFEVNVTNTTQELVCDETNASLLASVKNEPTIIKIEVSSPEGEKSTDSNCGKFLYHCPITNVKAEIDDALILEDEGSVGPVCPDTVEFVKQELDVGFTELKPPHMHFTSQPWRTDHDYHKPIIKDISKCEKPLVLEENNFTQQLDNDPHLTHTPGSLPQGKCEPMPQLDTQRAKVVAQPAHTDAPKRSKLLPHSPRVSAPIVHQDATHRDHIHCATSRAHEEKSCNDVSSENMECQHFHDKHNGERPINECECCGKRFLYMSVLNKHRTLHPCMKQFHCLACGKTFRQRSSMFQHMQVHAGEKPFECDSCGRKFRRKCSLITHSFVHADKKPFQCRSCSKGFCEKSSLIKHIRVHTGEKPFECETCGKAFRRKSTWTVHVRIHTGERPYECESCGKRFGDKSSLIKHKQAKTPCKRIL